MKAVILNKVFAILVIATAATLTVAQQAEHSGIKLFRDGKTKEAISPLNNATKSKDHKSDPVIWNTLGLAYDAEGELKKAVKAFTEADRLSPTDPVIKTNLAYAHLKLRDFSKAGAAAYEAIQLNPKAAMPYYVRGMASLAKVELDKAQDDVDRAIALDPGFSAAYELASEIQLALFAREIGSDGGIELARHNVESLGKAKEMLETGIGKTRGQSEKDRLTRKLEAITAFYNYFSKEPKEPDTPPTVPDPSVTPVKIIFKPRAQYSNTARANGTEGTISVAVLMGATGKIEGIILLNRLGSGLDENVIAAVKAIKFKPRTSDGKPVSAILRIEYGFRLY